MRSRLPVWSHVVVIIVVALFGGTCSLFAYKSVMLLKQGVETAGTVTAVKTYSCGKGGRSTCHDATVSAPDGVFKVSIGSEQVGSRVSLIYQDGNPSNAIAGGRHAAWLRLMGSMFGFGIIGLIFLWRTRRGAVA